MSPRSLKSHNLLKANFEKIVIFIIIIKKDIYVSNIFSLKINICFSEYKYIV